MPASSEPPTASKMAGSSETPAASKKPKYEYLPPTPTVELRASMNEMGDISTWDKFVKKFKQDPLVPTGCVLTAGALTYGLVAMRNNNKFLSQRMMRLRIVAQGFTIIACMAGVLRAANREKNKSKSKESDS